MSVWRDRWSGAFPRLAVVAHDLAVVWVVWLGLHWLRYSIVANPPSIPLWSTEVALVLVAQGVVFWQVGLYRGLWRFASVPDLWNILKASALGMVAIAVGLFLYNRLDMVSRLVLVLYPLVLIGSGRGPAFMAAFVLAWYMSAAFAWLWLQKRAHGGVIGRKERDRFE